MWRSGIFATVLVCVVGAARPALAESTIAILAATEWKALESISLTTLRQIYLGRRSQLSGQPVACLDLPSGSVERGAFHRVVSGKSQRSMERYWIEQALRGGAVPPREVATDEAMMRAVAGRGGVIGYVDFGSFRENSLPGVRILPLRIEGRLVYPADSDYPIRVPVVSALELPSVLSQEPGEVRHVRIPFLPRIEGGVEELSGGLSTPEVAIVSHVPITDPKTE